MAATRLTSEMAGSARKQLVTVGDDVAEGADLSLLEATEMEVPTAALAAIQAQEREVVSEGQFLLILAS